jgi:transcriptional regulator with XRE-family HTH domain
VTAPSTPSRPRILSLYRAGIHQSEIARRLGVSRQRVSIILKEHQARSEEEQTAWAILNYPTHCATCEMSGDFSPLSPFYLDGNPQNLDPKNLTALCRTCLYQARQSHKETSSKS